MDGDMHRGDVENQIRNPKEDYRNPDTEGKDRLGSNSYPEVPVMLLVELAERDLHYYGTGTANADLQES
jgi:hypothetical protein